MSGQKFGSFTFLEFFETEINRKMFVTYWKEIATKPSENNKLNIRKLYLCIYELYAAYLKCTSKKMTKEAVERYVNDNFKFGTRTESGATAKIKGFKFYIKGKVESIKNFENTKIETFICYIIKKKEISEIEENDIYKVLAQLFSAEIEEDEWQKLRERCNIMKTEIKNMIEKGAKQIILTGAPGTGKTRMAKEIATEMSLGGEYEFVQFHPSYDYTDFVEGLRPVEIETKTETVTTFKRIDGIFKKFCRKVVMKNGNKDDTGQRYFFIIDEINRADLSKVFGELMYCLESDKRGKENHIDTQYQNLPTYKIDKTGNKRIATEETGDCFADGFYIPKNVYIIGTMNDIDRSVESMDFALRRRFMWKEIKVNQGLLEEAFEAMCKDKLGESKEYSGIAKELAKRVDAMNSGVINTEGSKFGLGEQYYISQGQFANLAKPIWEKLIINQDEKNKEKVTEFLKEAFEWQIEPLLREYLRGEPADRIEDFIGKCRTALCSENGNDNNGDSNGKQ